MQIIPLFEQKTQYFSKSSTVVFLLFWLSIITQKYQQSASKMVCPCILKACSVFKHLFLTAWRLKNMTIFLSISIRPLHAIKHHWQRIKGLNQLANWLIDILNGYWLVSIIISHIDWTPWRTFILNSQYFVMLFQSLYATKMGTFVEELVSYISLDIFIQFCCWHIKIMKFRWRNPCLVDVQAKLPVFLFW